MWVAYSCEARWHDWHDRQGVERACAAGLPRAPTPRRTCSYRSNLPAVRGTPGPNSADGVACVARRIARRLEGCYAGAMATAETSPNYSIKRVAVANGVICTAAIAFLVWLVYFHESARTGRPTSILLPAINAALNSTSAALLAAGLFAIKQGRRGLHKQLMLCALAASTGFLVNYIIYHYTQGDTRFAGVGAVRMVYFPLLISHILLSVVALPMILWTLFLALTDRFKLHVRWAKWTWALWMYVSVTGVIVFLMLHVIRWNV